jgi:anti-anti-sigma factor
VLSDDGFVVVVTEEGLLVRGEVDLDSSDRLTEAIVGRPGSVVVSLQDVTFIDSSGLRGLIQASRGLSDRGDELTLRSPSPVVRRLLEITGLLDEFTLEA